MLQRVEQDPKEPFLFSSFKIHFVFVLFTLGIGFGASTQTLPLQPDLEKKNQIEEKKQEALRLLSDLLEEKNSLDTNDMLLGYALYNIGLAGVLVSQGRITGFPHEFLQKQSHIREMLRILRKKYKGASIDWLLENGKFDEVKHVHGIKNPFQGKKIRRWIPWIENSENYLLAWRGVEIISIGIVIGSIVYVIWEWKSGKGSIQFKNFKITKDSSLEERKIFISNVSAELFQKEVASSNPPNLSFLTSPEDKTLYALNLFIASLRFQKEG